MPRALATSIAFLAAAGALLSACGGSGTTVVTSSKPLASAGAGGGSPEAAASDSTSTSASADAEAAGSGGTVAQVSTTRTASAPAYVHEESSSGELGKAVAEVKARGYTPYGTAEYHPGQTLRVLVGTRTGSGDGYNQQAFFFLGNRYLGTDTSSPSAAVRVVGQSDTEVTLAYTIYHPGDPLCCPGGGQAHVTFQLNNGALAPAQTIPPLSERR
jgi:hypothetical protein